MSTSSSSAVNDLSVALPSCSYEPALCDDALYVIFARIPQVSSAAQALNLRRVNRVASRAIARTMRHNDTLKIDIRDSIHYKITSGMNRVKLDVPEPVIYIEDSRVTADKAEGFLELMLSKMKTLRRLEINMDDGDSTHLNKLLRVILAADNVRLETLRIRRRHAMLVLPLVVDLVRRHSATLRRVGRLGLTEASQALTKQMKLERLSLSIFDLGLEVPFDKFYEKLMAIASTGANFKHLSYTSHEGFDPSDEVIQSMLSSACVESLRLTMMVGPRVAPKPDYMIGKVRLVNELVLVEVVEKPSMYNRLERHEKIYEKVFPHVDDIHFMQQWD